MSDEKEILQNLVIDENFIEESQLKKLVSLIRDVVMIGGGSGKVFLKENNKLTNTERILYYLIGLYCSNKMGLRENNGAFLSELSSELGIPGTTLSAPLKTLLDNKSIRRIESLYSITSIEVQKFIKAEESEIEKVIE